MMVVITKYKENIAITFSSKWGVLRPIAGSSLKRRENKRKPAFIDELKTL